MTDVDVLYLTWNRLEFTRFTLSMLLENTNWDIVRRLVVYDDSSTDGTTDWVKETLEEASPVPWSFVRHGLGSPVAVMNSYVKDYHADLFAKVDSDIVVPPGWLDALVGVMGDHHYLELLGMEASRCGLPSDAVGAVLPAYTFEKCTHIGGVGIMRSQAFLSRQRPAENGRFGFTEWQHDQRPASGWISPDLLVASLDQVPVEPWATLSAEYVSLGWQRRWEKYDKLRDAYWTWWANGS